MGPWGIRAKAAVLPLALAFLLSTVACDQGPDEARKIVTQRGQIAKHPPAPKTLLPRSAELSSLASCGGDLVKSWGDRSGAVAWGRGPSGDEIVFSVGLAVYAVGADGSGLRMLSEAEGESGSAGTTALDVSPDGLQVVYTPCESLEGFSAPEHELAVARLDGGAVRQLTENTHFEKYPSWSPDGKRIAFVSSGVTPGMIYEWDDVHLYSMAADGTDVRRIAEGPLVHETPRWSPDGEADRVRGIRGPRVGPAPSYLHPRGRERRRDCSKAHGRGERAYVVARRGANCVREGGRRRRGAVHDRCGRNGRAAAGGNRGLAPGEGRTRSCQGMDIKGVVVARRIANPRACERIRPSPDSRDRS